MPDHGAAAAFFPANRYMGTTTQADHSALLWFYEEGELLIECLNRDDCRKMADAGMTIGSHTMNHVHLAQLDEAGAEAELRDSKQLIEKELGRPCEHFCCPFGRRDIDFLPHRDPEIARRVGYKSFLSGHRGAMTAGDSPMMVSRDHLLAGWGNYQLRYFFS
ncbi:MAG: polysaccharide deacetylase family protein [Proteobacteria bacterium]|nr:polysaccharide deacetylase family protein [Pseudomonadota bacterium]